MTGSIPPGVLNLAVRLQQGLLPSLKKRFVAKDLVFDLLAVSVVAKTNLFLWGPPGTAKSLTVETFAESIEDAQVFVTHLNPFTEPQELFGPYDIKHLRESGELRVNTAGMLPEAHFVFLDELFNCSSATLNSMLSVLNKGVLKRGAETFHLPALMSVGASNRLPQDETLRALYDRFLLRVESSNVPVSRLGEVLEAGWWLEFKSARPRRRLRLAHMHRLQQAVERVDVTPVRGKLKELVERIRTSMGMELSDRRAVKLQRVIAASALLCGRTAAVPSDLWVMQHIWDTLDDREVLRQVVQEAMGTDGAANGPDHPQSRPAGEPDSEAIARELDRLGSVLEEGQLHVDQRCQVADRLGLLAGQVAFVADRQKRGFLEERLSGLLSKAAI